jgi:hypothetical protein
MNPVVKGALQGAIPTLVLVGGTNLIVKKFRESKPVFYWGSLAVATGVAVAVVQGRIPAPFMNAESLVGQNCKFEDTGYCYTHDRHDCDFSPNFWDADYTDSDLSHFGKPLEHDEEFTTMQVRIGSPSGSTTSWTTAFNLQCIGDEDNLTYFTELLEDEIKSKVRQWNPKTIEDSSSKTTMQIVIGSPSGSTTSWYRAFEVSAHDEMDGEDLSYLSGEIQDLLVDKAKWWNGDEVRYDAETFSADSNLDNRSANLRELRKLLERELSRLAQDNYKIEEQLKKLERGTPKEYPIENIRDLLDSMQESVGTINRYGMNYLSQLQ